MAKIYKRNNYLFIEIGDILLEDLVSNVLITQAEKSSEVFYIRFKGNINDSIIVQFENLLKEDNTPFSSVEEFRDFYTSLQNTIAVNVDIDQPLTNSQLRSTPINVTVSNPVDLTTITAILNSIKSSCINIDANTDQVETKIDSVVTTINNNGSINHADLLNVISQLQSVNANTDTLESVLNSVLNKIISSPSTLAEQQTQTSKLIDILSSLAQLTVFPATQFGEYAPSDMTTVLQQNAKLSLDGSGNLNVRGSALTDEGSFRDDFSAPLSADWETEFTGNGTTSQATTIQTLSSGTTAGNSTIKLFTDYSPIIFKKLVQVSQRIANQNIIFGFRDNVENPNISAEFKLSGTINTTLNVVSSSSATIGNSETYAQTIPNAKTTAQYLEYEIQVLPNFVAFYIDGVLVRTCKIHVPTTGVGSELYAFFRIENSATVTNTTVNVDFIDISNMNLLEVKTDFTSKPISTQQTGDQHHITSIYNASATTADQTILSFTVPVNRVMYIIGLSIETSNKGGNVKIGKNTITTPASPGVVDSNMFRQFSMSDASASLDSYRALDYGSFPRIVGSNGDVFKILITPRGNQASVWSTTIDYILK